MIDDWRYSDDRMELRQKVYSLLLTRFGSALDKNKEPMYSMSGITQCSHDWVSQGHQSTEGIADFYENHYQQE